MTHGIMFHHFHDETKHIVGQGSISMQEFENLLDYYGETYRLISADEYLFRSNNHCLAENDVCITFDDGLLCQYDVAYPVLQKRKITAFWFIYTSPLTGKIEKLEIYRHFRFSKFDGIEEFYAAFFDSAKQYCPDAVEKLKDFNPSEYAKGFPFYTPNDKRFRYLRDHVLGDARYCHLMDQMIADYHYDISGNADLLWLKGEQIQELHRNGHIVGLHSHTHPTTMDRKPFPEQKEEYSVNKACLESITRQKIVSVSYPCNSYNMDTIRCMLELDIQIGFRANMLPEKIYGRQFEYPREDHANISRDMKEKKLL